MNTIPDIKSLKLQAAAAIESGDPADAQRFYQATGLQPGEFQTHAQSEDAAQLMRALVTSMSSQAGSGNYASGEWPHVFEPKGKEVLCRILIDLDERKLLAAQEWTGDKFEDVEGDRRKHLFDNVIGINEAYSTPEDWGLSMTTVVPQWAGGEQQRVNANASDLNGATSESKPAFKVATKALQLVLNLPLEFGLGWDYLDSSYHQGKFYRFASRNFAVEALERIPGCLRIDLDCEGESTVSLVVKKQADIDQLTKHVQAIVDGFRVREERLVQVMGEKDRVVTEFDPAEGERVVVRDMPLGEYLTAFVPQFDFDAAEVGAEGKGAVRPTQESALAPGM